MDVSVKYTIGLIVIIIAGIAMTMLPLTPVLDKFICRFNKNSKFCNPEYSERVRRIMKYTCLAVMAICLVILYFISRTI